VDDWPLKKRHALLAMILPSSLYPTFPPPKKKQKNISAGGSSLLEGFIFMYHIKRPKLRERVIEKIAILIIIIMSPEKKSHFASFIPWKLDFPSAVWWLHRRLRTDAPNDSSGLRFGWLYPDERPRKGGSPFHQCR